MITVDYRGLSFKLPEQDTLFSKNMYKFVDEVYNTVKLANIKPGGVFFEIGLCFGVSSITAVKSGMFRKAHAMEADRGNCTLAGINKELNKADVAIYPYAASDISGKGSLVLNSRSNIGGNIVTHEDNGSNTIDLITIDDLIAKENIDISDVTLVWCDAQGSEGRLIKGASKLLAKRIPWNIELAPELLERLGTTKEELLSLIEPHFTKFIDLKDVTAKIRPVQEIVKVFSHYKELRKDIGNGKTKASHTNVLLIP
jgi:FkbM family methyltransferase